MKQRNGHFALSARSLIALVGALLIGAGCDRGGDESAGEADSGEKVLNIYTWAEYLPESVLNDFTKETGIAVTVDTYDDNETLLAKLQSGVADYDLVMPSDYMVRILAAEKLVREIDRAKLSNWTNLDAQFLDKPFDPGNKFSVPYFWGTTGLGYRKDKVEGPVESWDVVFDDRNAGQILMLDDARECFAVALKRMGKSLNETDPAVLKEAARVLGEQKRLVKTYNSDDFATLLEAGDVILAHGYNGQLAKVVAADPERFGFVVPKEGGTFWMDNICVPSAARHADNAYAFIDFILGPEPGAAIVNAARYASANQAAKAHVKPEILQDEAVYPPADVLGRCEFMEDVGETTVLIDELWTEIKGAEE